MDNPKNMVTDQATEDTATISWDSVQAPIDRYMLSYTSADGDAKEIEVGKDRSITDKTETRHEVHHRPLRRAGKQGEQESEHWHADR